VGCGCHCMYSPSPLSLHIIVAGMGLSYLVALADTLRTLNISHNFEFLVRRDITNVSAS